MNEFKEDLKELVKETYSYFDGREHFDYVDDGISHDEEALRIYDVGYIKALEMVIGRLEELTTVEDYG